MSPPKNALADERLLSIGEVADLLRLSVKTVRRYVVDGTLPAIQFKPGAPYRFRVGDVRALLVPDGAR